MLYDVLPHRVRGLASEPGASSTHIHQHKGVPVKKILLGIVLAFAASISAFAAYPDKPVTIVVPFPPGGSTDAIARVLAQKLQEKLGGTFIIDNKPGATGTIGAAFVKR